ncbi:MAG: biotin--[acetyl-CoA-carboxylase] ligase [Moraxellaceae bacterium]|nr:biotin--[acetyl-CoA-carboxylase] ligase [Moraxellaceae bacterium]
MLHLAQQLTNTLYQNNHQHLVTSTSTNSELIANIAQDKINPQQMHLLTADRQSNGRGQQGRQWQSPQGNVYLSLYYPNQQAIFPFNQPLSGLFSLCVGYFLAKMPYLQQINQRKQQHKQPQIGVKWANDIGYYQQNLFYKLAGILIEPVIVQGQRLGIVIGVGFNVNNAPKLNQTTQETMPYQSVSFSELLHSVGIYQQMQVAEFYRPISQAILQAIICYQQISQDKQQNQEKLQQFLQDFQQVNILLNKKISVLQNNQQIIGKVIGINSLGCLQLRTDNDKVCDLFNGKIFLN